jgi:hypothetical protein
MVQVGGEAERPSCADRPSKGGIEWRPFKKQMRPLSWEKFDQIIRDHWND